MQSGQINMNRPVPPQIGEPVVPLFDFRSVARILRRRLPRIVAFTVAAMALGYGAVKLERPHYEARASLLLQAPGVQLFGKEEIFTATKFDNPMIESQLQVLRSPMLLSQVVQDLRLDRRAEFIDPPPSELAGRLGALAAKAKALVGVSSAAAAPQSEAKRFQDAVARLADSVSVSRSGLTQVLNVEVRTTAPALSAEIANAIAAGFVAGRYSQRADSAEAASDWLDARLADLNRSAAAVEARIAALGTGAAPDDPAPSGARSAEALASLRAAISARIAAENQLAQIEVALAAPNPATALPAGIEGDEIAPLKAAYESARALGDEASAKAAQLALREALGAERARASAALEAAQAAEALARTALTDARGAAGLAGSGGESRLLGLESEAKIYRDMHERYLQSYLQTAQQQGYPAADALVIGAAVAPDDPSGTGTLRAMLLAGVLGATLGIGSAFLRETGDPMVRSRAALAQATGAPVLGLLSAETAARRALPGAPRVDVPRRVEQTSTNIVLLSQNQIAADDMTSELSVTLSAPRSDYAETIRRIRAAFDARMAEHAPAPGTGQVLGFVSERSFAGRSIAAVNYAQMLAVGGKRTVLVDLDWTHAWLTGRIAPHAQMGVPELVMKTDKIAPERLFWLDARSGLQFLPNRALQSDDGLDPAVFDTQNLIALIRVLARRFDQVVIDFSGLGEAVDSAALGEAIDGYVICADWGKTSAERLEGALRAAGVMRGKIIGAVMAGATEAALARYEASV